MAIATTNPATGEVLKRFEEISDDEIESRLARAQETFKAQRLSTFAERARWMDRAAGLLDAEQEAIATTMSTEMGKTLKAARAETAKCARGFRYYAAHAEALLADEPADPAAVGATAAYARYQPLGVILGIMPWNFPLGRRPASWHLPLWRVTSGCLSTPPTSPRRLSTSGRSFTGGGFPEGSFQALLMGSACVERLVRDPRVAGVTLTGSGPCGRGRGCRRRGGRQAERPRTGRQRRLHRHAERRPRGRRQSGNYGPLPEQWAVVHRGKAVHRPCRSG